jgi:low temperature requirement protein LtrA
MHSAVDRLPHCRCDLDRVGRGAGALALLDVARVGFAIDLLTPFASPRMHDIVQPYPEHIEERFGTFINISLGEGFIGLVEAMRDQSSWSGTLLVTTALLLLAGFSIWWGFFDTLDQGPIAEVRKSHRTGTYKIWVFAQLPLAAGVAATGIAVGNLVHDADAGVLEDSSREAGEGRHAWFVVARKVPTIAAALLLGAFGAGLSPLGVAGLLAVATGAQVLWSIWDRAHADPLSGEDPGPGARARATHCVARGPFVTARSPERREVPNGAKSRTARSP